MVTKEKTRRKALDMTGDVFGSTRCDCGPQFHECLGILRQEGRRIGLYNKLGAYRLQDSGMDTFEANRALNFADDQRVYPVAAQMLLAIGISEIEILPNSVGRDRTLRLWTLEFTEQDVWVTDERPTTSGISSVAYDPQRALFLAGSYDGRVYELAGRVS